MAERATTQTIQHGPCTIIIHRPELTRSEREARERDAQERLERILREYYKRKPKTT